ncbi:uncharacterized protein BCR38DRAFT_485035 [Pseudomassariella vexata]|uniref:NWD NACHT-NTPase N-terminal domain-containing protein n=1 Tax=Pseudomassariella vexata TaxID=1141098 RepID=A0A1Y2DZ19_9PEZI|nr:uncharacterized protein BCR38DRAFT_485035 [Pseudomassariella vexata]ORY63885.1 hypothetical protein BCR38DRAFT_485035 [Pseudomassariella vexata]
MPSRSYFKGWRRRLTARYGAKNPTASEVAQDIHNGPGIVASPASIELQTLERRTSSTSSAPAQRAITDIPTSVPPASATLQQPDTKSSLWDKALERLRQSEEDQDIKTVEEIANNVASNVETPDGKPATVTDRAAAIKEEMEREITSERNDSLVENTVSILNKFLAVDDVDASFDPVHAALPWAAVRFVLVVHESNHHPYRASLSCYQQMGILASQIQPPEQKFPLTASDASVPRTWCDTWCECLLVAESTVGRP